MVNSNPIQSNKLSSTKYKGENNMITKETENTVESLLNKIESAEEDLLKILKVSNSRSKRSTENEIMDTMVHLSTSSGNGFRNTVNDINERICKVSCYWTSISFLLQQLPPPPCNC